jgi:hypothetical protein
MLRIEQPIHGFVDGSVPADDNERPGRVTSRKLGCEALGIAAGRGKPGFEIGKAGMEERFDLSPHPAAPTSSSHRVYYDQNFA